MMVNCQLEKIERCCCICMYLRKLRDFPLGASRSREVGFICNGTEADYSLTGEEHGLCEMHTTWDENCGFYREGEVEMEDSKGKFKVGLIEGDPE